MKNSLILGTPFSLGTRPESLYWWVIQAIYPSCVPIEENFTEAKKSIFSSRFFHGHTSSWAHALPSWAHIWAHVLADFCGTYKPISE
jgi:hypothetical protein